MPIHSMPSPALPREILGPAHRQQSCERDRVTTASGAGRVVAFPSVCAATNQHQRVQMGKSERMRCRSALYAVRYGSTVAL